VGFGLAFAVIPVQNVALTNIAAHDAGAASALVNSSMQIGGSIGLSVFTTIYVSTTADSLAGGANQLVAFTDGYSAVFLATTVILVIASIVGVTLLRSPQPRRNEPGADASHAGEPVISRA
jgi:hypothetical protein